ncbi:flagellar hook-basal body protein [bacterium BRH_c32]|nr:MAG: flagellar hook-basal body protein [bacterium BRH_c32]
MNIERLSKIMSNPMADMEKKTAPAEGFGNTLMNVINDVNKAQTDSAKAIEGFVSGEGIELHEVMLAGEKAKTSLDLLMEIRNKTLDMYKELTRIPL